ncbi:MAG: TetR/AcrR family transcriptional regulator [Ilumatobacteraceae bacterium]
MARGRKPGLTRDDYVDAAIAYIDQHGLESMTLKTIGDALGLSQTALYRYFRDKDDLIGASKERLVGKVAAALEEHPSGTPEERLMRIARATRQVFMDHPNMAGTMLVLVNPIDNTTTATSAIVAMFEELGYTDSALTTAYQAFESFVLGAIIFDFAGAPHHHAMRASRLRELRNASFDAMTRQSDGVQQNNDAAFELGLSALVRALVDRAPRTPTRKSRPTR